MLGHESNLLLGVKQLALFGAILGLVFSTGAISYQAAFADDDHDDKKFKKHKVLTGDGPPPEKLGKKGDLYFDSSDGGCMDFHVKIMKKEWEQRGTLCDESLIMIDWSQINADTIPENLLELAVLDCADGEIAKTESGEWECAEDDKVESLEELLQCDDGEIAKFESGEWECAEDDKVESLEELITCDNDEILKFDGTNWVCSEESGGDLSVSIDRTLLEIGSPGTTYFNWDEGANAEFEGIEVEGSLTIRLSCPTGTLLTGYDIIAPIGPLQVEVFTGTGSGPFDFEVLNLNTVDSVDPVEFLLFCAIVD